MLFDLVYIFEKGNKSGMVKCPEFLELFYFCNVTLLYIRCIRNKHLKCRETQTCNEIQPNFTTFKNSYFAKYFENFQEQNEQCLQWLLHSAKFA